MTGFPELQECAPGRAGGLQSRSTPFESVRSCFWFRPMWLEIERQRSCKPLYAGANPAVGSFCKKLSRWCSGRHRTLRRSRSWFNSRSGYFSKEVLRVCWTARQSSKLQDEVRFLGGALTSLGCGGCIRPCEGRGSGSTPDEDANDAGAGWPGNRLQPGRSGFDSHRRLFAKQRCLSRPAARDALSSCEAVGNVCSAHGF